MHAFAVPEFAQQAAIGIVAQRTEKADPGPWRAAAMAKLEVSPPKPCKYSRPSPAPVWLNSTMASPSARISGTAPVFGEDWLDSASREAWLSVACMLSAVRPSVTPVRARHGC
jgi:hypothetical protein